MAEWMLGVSHHLVGNQARRSGIASVDWSWKRNRGSFKSTSLAMITGYAP